MSQAPLGFSEGMSGPAVLKQGERVCACADGVLGDKRVAQGAGTGGRRAEDRQCGGSAVRSGLEEESAGSPVSVFS